ncbi:MAG: DNA translocase FtsK [Bacteroidales bacterium]|jgi:S-DNA-T family DNA segregation ATPase FtsK/SpoIIIE|nr:DNA translocase FtsK [Bacteroidales bacterium]
MAKQGNPLKTNTFKDDLVQPEILDDISRSEKKQGRKTSEQKEKRKQQPVRSESEIVRKEKRYRVLGLFFLLFSFYLLFSFTSYILTWRHDFDFPDTVVKHFTLEWFFNNSNNIDNWMGKIGALTGYLFITKWFGVASFIFIIILFNSGLKQFFHFSPFPFWKTLEYGFFGILWTPVLLGLIFPGNDLFSGVYGFQMNIWLTDLLGIPGLILALIFCFLSFVILAYNIPFRWFRKKPSIEIPLEEPLKMKESDDEQRTSETGQVQTPETPFNKFREENFSPTGPINLELSDPSYTGDLNPAEIELQIESPVKERAGNGKIEHQTLGTRYDPTLDLPRYKYPTLDLLSDYGGESISVRKEELEANKDKIVQTLSNYDIRIQKIKATIGPAVTLYEIVPEAGVRISRIKNLEDDIALSLAAMGIRIIAPIPGKGTIGIEVPNQNPEIVSIKSLLSTEKFKTTPFELPFVLGKTISNETFIADLSRMPHLLMAGATGQGKSVGLNTIITSLLYKKHPSQVKFVLIDPKKVELTLYTKIERHFLAKLPDSEDAIITDTKKVIRTLNSLNIEMDSRYDLLRDAQVRNIKEYNEKFFSRILNPNEGHHFLPYIVLVIDEFADLIMTAGREIETPLTRLAQLARATGIHLIIATQRPSVNIITGTIKANFPARIAFRVISKIDSRTILDSSGADQLIGRGDMLLSTGSDIIRLQCAFVDTPEIDRVTEFIGNQMGYPDAFALPEYYDEEGGSSKEFDPNERDEFFTEAARMVVQHQHGSTSLLQRKLKLGYNRAGRIIDQLEGAGIVGPFEGSKAREVRFKDLHALEEHLNMLGKS